MKDGNYWDDKRWRQVMGRPLSRRTFLAGLEGRAFRPAFRISDAWGFRPVCSPGLSPCRSAG